MMFLPGSHDGEMSSESSDGPHPHCSADTDADFSLMNTLTTHNPYHFFFFFFLLYDTLYVYLTAPDFSHLAFVLAVAALESLPPCRPEPGGLNVEKTRDAPVPRAHGPPRLTGPTQWAPG